MTIKVMFFALVVASTSTTWKIMDGEIIMIATTSVVAKIIAMTTMTGPAQMVSPVWL